MRVLVLGKATPATEAGTMPSMEDFEAMSDYNRQLVESGILIAGEGLKPSSYGKRIRFEGKKAFVTDGPFTESKELVAGFSIWRVKDMDEAIEWVKRCPILSTGAMEMELRPLYDAEDFGEVISPEVAAQEAAFRPEISDY